MIRKVYTDFLVRMLLEGRLGWLTKSGARYILTHLSYQLKKPFCGPILGSLIVNYDCNGRCLMCDMPTNGEALKGKGLKELNTGQTMEILDQFKDLGVLGVGFTGGEPLLRPDIIDLIGHGRSLGMITHLNTNGTLLDGTTAENLMDAGLDSINISVDGACGETHDGIRGVPGTFEKVVSAIGTLIHIRKSNGGRTRVKTVMVVSKYNVDEILDAARLVRDLGVDCIEFVPQQPFNQGGLDDPIVNEALATKVKRSLKKLGNLNGAVKIENSSRMMKLLHLSLSGESSPVRCYAGYNSIAVDCFGQVFPCHPWVNWALPVDDLGTSTLKEIWYSKDYRKVREQTARCRDCTLNGQVELNLLFQPFRRIPEFRPTSERP